MLCNGIMTWNHASFNSYFLLFWHFLTRKPPGSHFFKKRPENLWNCSNCCVCEHEIQAVSSWTLHPNKRRDSRAFLQLKRNRKRLILPHWAIDRKSGRQILAYLNLDQLRKRFADRGTIFKRNFPKKVYQFFTILHEMQVEQKPTTVMTLQTLLLRKRRV